MRFATSANNGSRLLAITALIVLLILPSAPLRVRADEKTDKAREEQYLSLAATRTKAELACRKVTEISDENRNGWNDAIHGVEDAHQKLYTLYAKAIQSEQAKAEGDRNQAVVEDLSTQMQTLDQDYQAAAREREKVSSSYRDALTTAQNATQVYQNLVNQESPWKAANMDLAPLSANYDLVARTVSSAIASLQKTIDELKDRQREWDQKVEATTKILGGK